MHRIIRRPVRALPFVLALVLALVVPLTGQAGAAPAPDEERPPLAASVEAYGGGLFVGDDLGDADAGQKELALFGGSARVLARLPADLTIQGDVEGKNYTNNDEMIDNFDESVLGAGHFSVRNGENFLFGGFGGGGYAMAEGDRTEIWFVGAEMQAYLGPVTLYGQGGYLDTVNDGGGSGQSDGDALHQAPFGRAVARYFPTDNLRLQLEGSFAHGQQDSDDQEMDVWGWGVRADAGLPFEMEHGLLSVFAGYQGGYYDNGTSGGVGGSGDVGSRHDHGVRVGITLHLGAEKTLLERDRHGANLDLPPVDLWAASGFIVD